MSMPEVLATIEGAFKDDAVGLAAKIVELAGGDARVRSDVAFGAWALTGNITDARGPNVAIRPLGWAPDSKRADQGHRDAVAQVEVSYEYFGNDLETIQQNVTFAAAAVAQVVDELRAYSDAHGGTIVEVIDPLGYTFGDYAGPTSHGFKATITLTERSTL